MPSNFGLAKRPLPSLDSSLVQSFDGGVDWGPCLEPGGEGGRVPSGCVKRWNVVSWAALMGDPHLCGLIGVCKMLRGRLLGSGPTKRSFVLEFGAGDVRTA